MLETTHQAFGFVETTHQLSLPYSVLSNRPFIRVSRAAWFQLPGPLLNSTLYSAKYRTGRIVYAMESSGNRNPCSGNERDENEIADYDEKVRLTITLTPMAPMIL